MSPYQSGFIKSAKGWLGVKLPKNMARAIKALHKSIDKKDLTEDGLDKDPHITLAYGIAEKKNPMAVKGLIEKSKPVDVALGNLSTFKNPDATVLKFEVHSPTMQALHKRIKEKIGMPGSTHPKFQPHVTVAYLKPGTDVSKYDKLQKKIKGSIFTADEVEYNNDDKHMDLELKAAAITLDIEKGDTLLGGRFKNVKHTVKAIGTDDLGQPTVNGMKLLGFRIAKLMPKSAAYHQGLKAASSSIFVA